MKKTVIAVICLVLTAASLAAAGFSVGYIAEDIATVNRLQNSLDQARTVEGKLRQILESLATAVDDIIEQVKGADSDSAEGLPDTFSAAAAELKDVLQQLSDLCGEDYSFLPDSLPLERYQKLIESFIAQKVREDVLDDFLDSDNPLRGFAEGLLGGDGEDVSVLDIAGEVRALLDYDFIGALEEKVAQAKASLTRNIVIFGAETLLAVGLAVTAVLLLKPKKQPAA